MPVLEATFFGLPIISTDVGVTKDIIGNSEGGKIIKHRNTTEMAQGILELLSDKKKYKAASSFV